MKKLIFTLVVALLLTTASSPAIAEKEHKYIGVKKCAMCHKSESKGSTQYQQWKAARHSKAFESLKTDTAKKDAEKLGITVPPTEAPECLKCHVTGYGKDPSLFSKKFKPEDGVQCEACHGAGGDYYKKKIMKDREKAIANGLVIPDEKVCVTCHNEESPHYKPFVFDEFFPKIAHPFK